MTYAELIAQLIIQGKFEPPPEPPLFAWRTFTAKAETIVAVVSRPVRVRSVNGYRERPGVDLTGKVEGLARLLADVAEEHAGAVAYAEAAAMHLPRFRKSQRKRPRKKPGKNALLNAYEAVYQEAEFEAEHKRMLDVLPRRGRGNPSRSRDQANFPIGPLIPVFWMAKKWWEDNTGLPLSPTFAGGDDVTASAEVYDDADDTDEIDRAGDYNNSGSRFILAVFQFVEPRCKAAHAERLCSRRQKLSE